jgi:STAM-binding protein
VESCGILAGVLDEKNGCFQISTLIIPKQEGTSDTVQARTHTHTFPSAGA